MALFVLDRIDEEVRRALRRERLVRDELNPLDRLNDLQLYTRFRFDRVSILQLTDLLDEDLSRATHRSHALPSSLQVLLALEFFASGARQSTTGATLDVSKWSVSTSIRRVSLAIVARIGQFVVYPTDPAELAQVRAQFHAMAGFPGVCGVIDGTQIKIKAPIRNEWEYVGRKRGHTMNIQCVALPDCSFSHVLAKYPGRVHDARMFTESSLHADLVAERKHGFLIGDSAYPLSRFLLKPFSTIAPAVTLPEQRYQRAILATRATVERAFGQLKGRWTCLHQELLYSPDRCCTIIAACVALHNFAIRRRLPAFFADENRDDDDDEDNVDAEAAPARDGLARQRQLIEHYFTPRH